ncbi:DNA cytosine methyltransferase [Magnetospirillum sp. UT-4]|uniref:DNA cytosine methyltransferase n=1 Tax=Magnetospirillum sp. UT-4 TaxID=2681467 RepID=UPI00137FFFFF|nr:DNA (cytosine-5-)-methyltransferase [Magnetospirillum sp. UT-4]CAA7618866.1 putative Modification methylase SinI [Magnetospirillum sp. UT-4]
MARNSFVSLFSGAGGLDIGLEEAGWVCHYASDLDQDAVETLTANKGRRLARSVALNEAFVERADVRHSMGRDILAKGGIRRGDVTLLAGGPPCQSWSSAGHQHGFEDPRGQLFADFVRLAGELDVRWLVFENVRGLLTARGPDGVPGTALQLIRAKLLSAGFQTAVTLLNAADFGLAQRRVRLFVIGYRAGDIPPFPVATHGKDPVDGLKPWMPLRACLSTLSPLAEDEVIRPSGKLAHDLALVSPGSGVKSPGKAETTRPGGHWGYKQGAFVADLAVPARTVTASAQQDWVKDPVLGLRRLCPRECAAIQTFPPTWAFAGNRTSQYRQIGNAVPPRLAELVGKSLLDHVASQPTSGAVHHLALLPLPDELAKAVRYTAKEEARNGQSRRAAAPRRVSRIPVLRTTAI